jgi:WD40 repeat protein/uncharacterized caspase-like protein
VFLWTGIGVQAARSLPGSPDLPEPVIQSNHAGKITSLAASPDSNWVASGSVDGTVKLWSNPSGLLVRTIPVTSSWVRAVAFSPDGNQLAVGAGDHGVTLYEAASGTVLRRFQGAQSAITIMAFLEKGAYLAALTTRDSKLYLWSTAGAADSPLESPDPALIAAATARFPRGGPEEMLIARDAIGRIIARANGAILDWAENSPKQPNHHQPISAAALRSVQFSPDGHSILTTSNRGDLAVWDLESGALSHYLPDAAGATAAFASSAAFSRDGTAVSAVRGPSRQHWSWTLSSLTPLKLPARSDRLNGFTVDYFPEAGADVGAPSRPMPPQFGIAENPEEYVTTRAALSKSGEVAIYSGFTTPTFFPYVSAENLKDGTAMWTYRADAERKGRNIYAIVVSSDGSQVNVAFDDRTVLWLDASGSLVKTEVAATQRPINILTLSRQGDLLAGATGLGEIVIWRRDGTTLLSPPAGPSNVLSLAFSEDGRVLAIGAADRTIKLWDVAAGRMLPSIEGHTSAVTALAFGSKPSILLSGSEDSTLRIWNWRSGELLATAIASPGGDWISISPQGFFDGTRGGWNTAYFRFASDPMHLYRPEQFFKQFYQPGLLADVIGQQQSVVALLRARGDNRASLNVASLRSSKLPMVELKSSGSSEPAHTAQLNVSVLDGGSGMRDLRIFRNGSLVQFIHGDLKPGAGGKFSTTVAVELTAGPNELSAYAFNADDLKSEDAIVSLEGGGAPRAPGRAYVIAVGIDKYSNSDFDLRYAGADAALLSSTLNASFDATRTYHGVTIPLLDSEATRQNLLFALHRLAGETPAPEPSTPAKLQQLPRVHPEDAVVLYFAGHGEALHGKYYLIPHDLGYAGRKEAIKEPDLEAILSRSITDQDLSEALERIDAGQMMLVIDACYSGQLLESTESRRGPLNSRGIAQLAYEKGAYVLTASQSDIEAQELARLGHGVLTYVLVEQGLKKFNADLNGDGVVTVREWFRYAEAAVPGELTALKAELVRSGRPISVGGNPLTVQRPQFYFRREMTVDWLLEKRIR